MSALEDALYEYDTDKAIVILDVNHNLLQRELDSALTIAVSPEGPDSAITPLLSHGAKVTEPSFCEATSNLVALQAFLYQGWDINSLEFSQPALRLAVGDENIVRWCLDHGADPNLQGTVGCSVLATAALEPSTSTIELLISYGAQLDPRALFHAMNPRGHGGIPVMKYLIDKGVNVNAIGTVLGSREGTPLHYAVKLRSKEKVAILLEAGADKNIKNFDGILPADMAKEKGCTEISDLLSPD